MIIFETESDASIVRKCFTKGGRFDIEHILGGKGYSFIWDYSTPITASKSISGYDLYSMLNHNDPTLKAIKQTYKRLNPNLAPDMTPYKVKSVLCDFEAKYMASSEESKISDTKNSIYAMKNVLKAGVYSQHTLLRL